MSRQLADQNEQLRDLDRMKDELVALVSHELRTPLTSIIGYLEMVVDDGLETLTPNQQTYLATVSRNVERLTTLVNDLLFLVTVDSSGLQLDLAEADINQLLVEAAEAARPAADRKEIEFNLETEELAPIVCDRARIAQLVDNLVVTRSSSPRKAAKSSSGQRTWTTRSTSASKTPASAFPQKS